MVVGLFAEIDHLLVLLKVNQKGLNRVTGLERAELKSYATEYIG